MYIYLDDMFAYKSKIYKKDPSPMFNLQIDLFIQEDSQKIVIEFYDATDSEAA